MSAVTTADAPTYECCPNCGRTVPADPRFVTWCDGCEWNVDPLAEPVTVPGWRRRLETRLADGLYRELERGRLQRPGWDLARVAAALLSVLVLLVPVGCLAFAVFAVLSYRPLWFGILLALVALGIGWLFCPRPNRLYADDVVVERDQAPVLFRVLDAVADAVGTDRVAAVVVDAKPNLWFARIGLRGQPVVGIGLPLWLGLGPQERVALLAHELGHGRNGDARHGWLVGNARGVLDELLRTFHEQPLDDYRHELGHDLGASAMENTVNLAGRFVNAVCGGLVRAYATVLDRVELRSNQRGEYLADRVAARVAGSEATARALDRLVLGDAAYRALERTVRYQPDADPAATVRRAVGEIPARELERRLRQARLRETRIDVSHPPTYLRSRLVRAQPVPVAQVVLQRMDANTTDTELVTAAAPVLKVLSRPDPD
jgi:Zn-dependent protease with chaperone function